VTAAYQAILGRAPDAAGLAGFSSALDLGVLSHVQFASELTHSAEYYSNIVQTAYQTYLGRTPTPDEVHEWAVNMQRGLTDEQLEGSFVGSAEYVASHGGVGAGLVAGMYQDLLGRTATSDEVNYCLRQFRQGVTPQEFAYGIALSPEREGRRVVADYQQFLGRTPSADEKAVWVQAFQNGKSNEDVVAGFVGSDEFFQAHSH
jgi:hypothetical protein